MKTIWRLNRCLDQSGRSRSPWYADIQAGLMTPEETKKKYAKELHANELVLLAYYIAAKRGLNVDQPRNLAKSVTVE